MPHISSNEPFSESELKESKNEIEKNWTACQEMFEKTGPNVDPKSPKLPKSPKIEKANLEILKKFEEIKNQAKVLGMKIQCLL